MNSNKPVIVVLGAGFIGMNLVREALAVGHEVRVLDHKPCPPELSDKVCWQQGDLANKGLVRELVCSSSVVFHLIANTVPGDTIDELKELTQNVGLTLGLLEQCVKRDVRRVVFVSSSSVYGSQARIPIDEEAVTNPISSHGVVKLSLEKYIQLYSYHYGLDCKIARLSNPYGPGQPIHGRQGVIAILMGKILSGGALTIRGDGNSIRDFIYIADVAQGLLALGQVNSEKDVFNLGSGIGYSLNQVIEIVEALIGKEIAREYLPARKVDIPVSILDVTRIGSLGCMRSLVSFERGLASTLAFHGIPMI